KNSDDSMFDLESSNRDSSTSTPGSNLPSSDTKKPISAGADPSKSISRVSMSAEFVNVTGVTSGLERNALTEMPMPATISSPIVSGSPSSLVPAVKLNEVEKLITAP